MCLNMEFVNLISFFSDCLGMFNDRPAKAN